MEAFEIIRATMNEFNEVPDDTVNMFLSLTEPLISKKRFGKMYQQARAYLAAHKMKLSGFGVSGGIGSIGDTIGLASVSEGETSVSFFNNQAGNTDKNSEFARTVYGMQDLQLRKSLMETIVSEGIGHDGKKNVNKGGKGQEI